MDLLGYAALGGLERLTIVAGAVIIGYWGYRLYTAEKNAGLIFMGLSVVVLVGALATGGSYLRSVGEGYQLASLPASEPQARVESSEPSESSFTDPADAPVATTAPPPVEPAAAIEPAAEDAPTTPQAAPAIAVAADETTTAPVVEPEVEAVSQIDSDSMDPEDTASPVRLATGQELGGRIVSVKSENVSLEWSADSE